jgi:hypothetical protein
MAKKKKPELIQPLSEAVAEDMTENLNDPNPETTELQMERFYDLIAAFIDFEAAYGRDETTSPRISKLLAAYRLRRFNWAA